MMMSAMTFFAMMFLIAFFFLFGLLIGIIGYFFWSKVFHYLPMRKIAVIVPPCHSFCLLKGIRLYNVQYLQVITFLSGIVKTGAIRAYYHKFSVCHIVILEIIEK